jgi:hypothetical protein
MTMVFISRDPVTHAINGILANQAPYAMESLDDSDPIVVAFLAPRPLPIPDISDRQFFQQLAIAGIITQTDALASNAAVIPPVLMTLIDAMPVAQQFNAKMIISGATTFKRNDPLTESIGAAYGMTPAQIDQFFLAAAQL